MGGGLLPFVLECRAGAAIRAVADFADAEAVFGAQRQPRRDIEIGVGGEDENGGEKLVHGSGGMELLRAA